MLIKIPYNIDIIEVEHADGLEIMAALKNASFYQKRYLDGVTKDVYHGASQAPTFEQGTLNNREAVVFNNEEDYDNAKAAKIFSTHARKAIRFPTNTPWTTSHCQRNIKAIGAIPACLKLIGNPHRS